MLRTALPALLGALLALPLAARGEPAPGAPAPAPDDAITGRVGNPEGRIESEVGRVEILGKPVRVGEKLELPEGFIRVEEEGTEDGRVGSFTVVPAETLRPTVAALAAAGGGAPEGTEREAPALAGPPSPAAPAAGPAEPAACRRERTEYLRELWKESGIEVDDPGAVLEGLEAGAQGAATGYYWFALATDPFRPLAWSSDLRARADALARCVRED